MGLTTNKTIDIIDKSGNIITVQSVNEAAKYLKRSRETVKSAIQKGYKCAGYTVRHSSNYIPIVRHKERVMRIQLNGKPDGEYDSIIDAARVNGCSDRSIRKAIRNGTKAKGYFWDLPLDGLEEESEDMTA